MVFHLAAQPLVRRSYAEPLETFHTNALGTANVLECIRRAELSCVTLVITSDKCYENREWEFAYRENDPLGGHDVYSMSKGGDGTGGAGVEPLVLPAEPQARAGGHGSGGQCHRRRRLCARTGSCRIASGR